MKTCWPFFLAQDSLVAKALGETLRRSGCHPVIPSSAPAEALPVFAFAGTPQEHRKGFFSDLSLHNCLERLKNGAIVYWPCRNAPWESYNILGPRDQEAFRCAVLLVKTSDEVVKALKSPRKIPPWAIERVERVLQAKDLFGLLEDFSHGGSYDITNQILGPARLLLGAGEKVDAQANYWDRFLSHVIDRIQEPVSLGTVDSRPRGGHLGRELLHHAGKLPRSTSEWDAAHIPAIDGLLALLTNSRGLAGIKISDGRKVTEGRLKPLGIDKAPCRLLVVDDHASSWRPVLALIHRELQVLLREDVRIDFSTNGTTLTLEDTGDIPLLGATAEYDAVLLDVFLGEIYGLEILRDIRTAFLYTPVIIWTTARELELPASANLANGFVFKKTTTIKNLVDVLGRWLRHGRAARAATIPNRYFDHAIGKLKYREAIQALNRWSLQLLDGFPALNESYFCNFTDHGGRHFIQLLDYMEQIVRPLALTGHVFSKEPERREEEITVLYLALLCHEFGMFPVFENEEHSFARLEPEENNAVRALHSIRGMEYLEKDFLNSGLGRAVAPVLRPETFMHAALCLIVGYHSRLLPIEHFGSAKDAEKEIEKRGAAAAKSQKLYIPGVRSVTETLSRLTATQCFAERKTQIQALCSLVRFVDAIDVDQSRLPPKFLRDRLERNPQKKPEDYALNQREYLKRQLVGKVSVDRGSVSFELMVPAPDNNTLASIAVLGVPSKSLTLEQALSPWDPLHRPSIVEAKKSFEDFLTTFFLRIARRLVASQVRLEGATTHEALPTSEALTADERGQAQRAVATIAALTVAGEILEEYRAIEECTLKDVIKLGEFKWGVGGWNPDETELKCVE